MGLFMLEGRRRGGDRTSVYRYLIVGVKKREPGSSQRCPVSRQWAH